MKVGYIQSSPVLGDKEKNFKEISRLAEGIKADLLVLPELFATGYAFQSVDEVNALSEGPDGETSQFLKKLSEKTGAMIVAGFIERNEGKNYNSAMTVFMDKLIGIYRKIHLYNREKEWFEPGNTPLPVYSLNGAGIGVMICFDWIFPETARTLALKGAQLIAHPSNLVMPWCQKAMITRCIENRVFAVTANRVGREEKGNDHFLFTGESQVISYNGDVLSKAPADKPFADIVETDLSKATDKYINAVNNLITDRRPEFYL